MLNKFFKTAIPKELYYSVVDIRKLGGEDPVDCFLEGRLRN